jgi:hypothetical protein
MSTERRDHAARPIRARPEGVVPLELWDLELHAGILWDHMEPSALPGALVEAVERLRRGTARTRSNTPICEQVRDLRILWLTGGRATSIDPAALHHALGLPVWLADAPTTVAERGARALVPEASALAVIDLGQSRLKLHLGDHCFEHERPRDRLPLLEHPTSLELARARTVMRAFIGAALRDAADRTRTTPDAVVVALPCELPDEPVPGSSSYPGLQGDAELVADVLAAAGWSPARVLVLNDAELAAVAAGLDPRTHGALTLVLTLGFGVGAALRLP